MFVDQTTISLLFPEMILVFIATFIYVVGTFNPHPRWWATFSVITLVAVLGVLQFADNVLWLKLTDENLRASGPLAVDYLGQVMRSVAVLLGLLFTLMNWPSANSKLVSERLGTLMLVVVGVMLVSRANELVLLFLGLELVSIPTYVLLFLGRRDRASAEATVKYFFLSILSSGVLLYGFSFLYGLGGSTSLVVIRQTLLNPAVGASANMVANLLPVALVLIVAGLGFKIAAAPFHFYAPDVYQGTTNANAGLLAVAPKIAGIVALLRIVLIGMPSSAAFSWQMVIVLAIVTMTLGNVCALWQKNVRRLLAYSSIAHAGYMLIGLAVGLAAHGSGTGYSGVAAMLFYLVVYAFASTGMFAALTYLETDERPINGIDDLAGLGQRSPVTAVVITVCMLSFAGIPVFAGFWGKYALFVSALELATGFGDVSLWFTILAVVGAINAAIGAAYYLRVIAVMFFHAPRSETALPDNLAPRAAMLISSVLVVLFGLLPGVPFQQARQAAESVQPQRGMIRADISPAPAAIRLTAKP